MTIVRAPPGWLFIIIHGDSYLTARVKRDSSIIMPGTHWGRERDTDELLHYVVSVYKHQTAELLKCVNHIFREAIVEKRLSRSWIIFSVSVDNGSLCSCPLISQSFSSTSSRKSQESSRRTAWLWWCNCWCYRDMIRDWPWCRPCLMHSPASSRQRDRVPVHWSAALTITDVLQQCLCGTNVPRCWSRRTCRDASRQTDLQSYLQKQLMFVKCARYTFSALRQVADGHFSFCHDRIRLRLKTVFI